MRFVLSFLVLALQPLAALAMCEGDDLIAALPAPERAALEERAAATVHADGLLWRATRGSTEITWFGTYHFPHDAMAAHLAALEPHIASADAIYLEVSNDDQALLQKQIAADPSMMFITEGPTLPDLLGEPDWTTYKAAMAERAIPGFMAAKFKPIWAAIMLGIGPCEARADALEGKGIDVLIGEAAASKGVPSRSLEDFRLLLTTLDTFPQEDQLDMIRLFFAWTGKADDMAYTLRQRYLAQETGLIWEFSRKISLDYGGETAAEDFALMEEQLLTRRNEGWIDLLLGAAEGKRVFAAVGAAHLPGENGVLNLLAQNGFAVTRLAFDP